jgi:D-inositol-3-phosphate glycosyltransferase
VTALELPEGVFPDPSTPLRVAMLSVHTSPLDQPGTGDAGGMNVYVTELAHALARRGTQVEIFTRATASSQPRKVEVSDGVTVRHVVAGPFEGLDKNDLPGQLCAFTAGVLRAEARHHEGWYDVVHTHYWLSGQVGWLAADRWDVPLVHSMHTMAKVKKLTLADDDAPEPAARAIGEAQVVAAADRLVANTADEGCQLVELYDAYPEQVAVVPPGVDLDLFSPGPRGVARKELDLPDHAFVLLFVGRIQPLKAPDVLLRAAARLVERDPALRERLVVAIVGGPSGSGLARPESLQRLAAELGLLDCVRFVPPVPQEELPDWYRAADLTVVPSYSESFGLVAVESQACGTPVVAAAVGGLCTAVADGVSGVLIDGHDPRQYADVLGDLARDPDRRDRLARGALLHAGRSGWASTAVGMLDVYSQALLEHEARPALAVGR